MYIHMFHLFSQHRRWERTIYRSEEGAHLPMAGARSLLEKPRLLDSGAGLFCTCLHWFLLSPPLRSAESPYRRRFHRQGSGRAGSPEGSRSLHCRQLAATTTEGYLHETWKWKSTAIPSRTPAEAQGSLALRLLPPFAQHRARSQ